MTARRFPDELIERIKTEIRIEDLVREGGIELRPHGSNDLIGRCKFHDDHTPSLVLTPGKGLWHCLGACQAGGSVIDWVMKVHGCSFRAAVEILRTRLEGFGFEKMSVDGPPPKKGTVPVLSSPIEIDADDRAVLLRIVEFYATTLKACPEAVAYLARRGLESSELIDRFQLGYGNRTLGMRLPQANRREGGAIRTQLAKLGILRENGREHFFGSIVFPVFDEHGQVVEIYGRKIGKTNVTQLGPPHLYLSGPRRGVWNWEALVASKEIILCEALIDAATLWCAGFRNVTASYGVNGFTPDHLAAFKKHATERVLIAYDPDEAGNKAAESLSEKLRADGIGCYRVQFPKGLDANEYALKVQPAERALDLVIRKASWMGNGRPPSHAFACVPAAAPPATPARARAREAAPPLAASAVELEAAKEKKLSGTASAGAPMPVSADIGPLVERNGEDEIVLRFDDRRYRVRGLSKATSFGVLRLNMMVTREGVSFEPPSPISGFHVDTFDLYSSRQRGAFEKQAGFETGSKTEAVRHDLGRIIRALEEIQQQELRKTLEPKNAAPAIGDEDRADALELLTSEDLLGRIAADLERCGLVGERTNKLVAYLACVSRLLDRPLAVIVQSSSAAGKSFLMDSILAMLPPEGFVKYAAMSGQALFYFDEGTSLKHKVLAISEEEGAETASYALKILQSEGVLTIASTGKDGKTGRLTTKEYRVEGPVMIFLTTTSVEIDEELRNRCLVLTVDESREQTRKIQDWQREQETIEGILAKKKRDRILDLHRNAQRLLRPIAVANPFSPRLSFLDSQTRTRRDNPKYLTLIRTIALLHQFQREKKVATEDGLTVEYIEATVEDITLANTLAAEVFGRSLDDLPPQTRRFLSLLHRMIVEACEREKVDQCDWWVTQRDIRQHLGWSDFQVRSHLCRLVELEYVLTHKGPRGHSLVYELLYEGEGKDGSTFLMGLADVGPLLETARFTTTTIDPRGKKGRFEGYSSPIRAPFEGHSSGGEKESDVNDDKASGDSTAENSENEPIRGTDKPASHTAGHRKPGAEDEPPQDRKPNKSIEPEENDDDEGGADAPLPAVAGRRK